MFISNKYQKSILLIQKNISPWPSTQGFWMEEVKHSFNYILLHAPANRGILQLHKLEESILISKFLPMQSSTLFRNRQLNEVSKNVLRLINNKMYPLNQQKMNKIIKSRRKQKLTKVQTEPSEPLSLAPTFKNLPKNRTPFHEFEERTMGEHFNQFQTRELMQSRIQNKEYELMTEKINDFIWAKRQEMTVNLARKKLGKEIELQALEKQEKKCHMRRNSSNMEHLLVKLRKKLKEEYRRESEVFQTPICRFSDVEERQKSPSNVNFFQQNEGIERVMERYPIQDCSRVRVKEDPNKQFQNDFLQEIKNSQSNDKYTRMRISINHRKIVSLK